MREKHIQLSISELRKNVWLLVCLLIITIVFLGLGVRKDIWFCDEVYTYESANSGRESSYTPINDGEWVQGSDITKHLAADTRGLNFKIIETYLYTDHVPLYFFIFRVVSLLAYGSCSKWIGLSINLLFYWIFSICVYKILEKVSLNSIFTFGATVAIVLHPVVLSQATTIRMYMMLVAFIFALMIEAIKKEYTFKDFILIAGCMLGGLLCHYYFWAWTAIFSAILIIWLIGNKKFKSVITYILVCTIAFAGTIKIYPACLNRTIFDTNSKAMSTFNNVFSFDNFFERIKSTYRIILQIMCIKSTIGAILFVACVCVIIAFYIWKCKERSMALIMLFSAGSYAVIIGYISIALAERYLWAPVTILFLVIVYMLMWDVKRIYKYESWGKMAEVLPTVMLGCLMLFCIGKACVKGNIMYLYDRPIEEKEKIEENVDCPWIVFSDLTDWRLHCSYYDFRLAEKVRLIHIDEEAQYDSYLSDADEIVVYTYPEEKPIENCLAFIKKSTGTENLQYEQIGTSYEMTVYKVFQEGE